ncbi:hypothetical protein BH09PSE5_BH09PSE5_06900 [soil metagenome]
MNVERKRRWYNSAQFEFRLEACKLIEAGQSVPVLAQALAMPARTLEQWLKQKSNGLFEHEEGPAYPTPEQEQINRLRGQRGRITAERDILQALLAFSSTQAAKD